MRLLLDTHSFLWFILGDGRCSQRARDLIEDESNEKWLSPASHWELAIKISIGKYQLAQPFEQVFDKALSDNGFRILAIETKHTAVLTSLRFHHRDPFDRLMIAQAISERMDVVSADGTWDAYPISRHC